MADYKSLCAKLTEDVRYLSGCLRNFEEEGVDPVCLSECEADYYEARAALAAEAHKEDIKLDGDIASTTKTTRTVYEVSLLPIAVIFLSIVQLIAWIFR